MANGGEIELLLLGWDRREVVSVESLRTGGIQDISQDTIQSLLGVDPFAVHGPGAPLNEPRYEWLGEHGFAGVEAELSFSRTVVSTDTKVAEHFEMRTVDLSPGLLSFAGIGPQERRTDRVVLRQGGARTMAQGQSVEVDVHLEGFSLEHHCVEAYYDRVFGGIAVRETPCGAESIAGVAEPDSLVSLVIGGRRIAVRADSQGRFSFRSNRIKPGEYALMANGTRRVVRYSGSPVRNLDLRRERGRSGPGESGPDRSPRRGT